MHECSQKELIENIRLKVNDIKDKFDKKISDLFEKYNELKIRTELQEEKISSIKNDLKELKDTVKDGFEKAEKSIEEKLNELKEIIQNSKKENNKILMGVIGAMGFIILAMAVYIATCGKFGGI